MHGGLLIRIVENIGPAELISDTNGWATSMSSKQCEKLFPAPKDARKNLNLFR